MKNELVKIEDGKLITNSLHVARVFGRDHKNIIQRIKNLDCSEDFRRLNFQLVDYFDAKGEKRPMYTMTRDGFVFCAMGMTGKKASKFKEDYITAFNSMEQKLHEAGKSTFDDLTEQEQEGLKRENQVNGTRGVRDYLIRKFGSQQGLIAFIWWSSVSHERISGRTTKETKELGRAAGLKAKDRQSAKDVSRNLEPHVAFGQYIADLAVTADFASKDAIRLGNTAKQQISQKTLSVKKTKSIKK